MVAAARRATRLVGAVLVAVAQLLLALIGVGFFGVPLTLVAAAALAVALRLTFVAAPGRHAPLATRFWFGRSASPSASEKLAQASTTDEPIPPPEEARPRAHVDAAERAAWLGLGGVLLAALVRSLLVPEAGWDAYSHWGLRAQAYALAGTLVNAGSEHEYYPPLVPLL